MLRQVAIQKFLEHVHRQPVPAGAGIQATAAAVMPKHNVLPFFAGHGGGKGGDQVPGIHTEKDPVDGFKVQGRAVEIHQLCQGVAGGMILPLGRAEAGLDALPAGFGRGQGVVPVPHRQVQIAAALLFFDDGGDALRQGAGDGVAPQVTAAKHQLQIVEQGQLLPHGVKRLNQLLLPVIAQQHDVGAFHPGPLPDPHPGRDAGGDGALGSPDQGLALGGIVIAVQIHHAHQADTGAGLGDALHQHIALVYLLSQNTLLQVGGNMLLDAFDPVKAVLQIDLRKDDM